MTGWCKYGPEALVRAFDFTSALAPDDTIAAADATMKIGDIVVSRVTSLGGVVTFWLTGGSTPEFQTLSVKATTVSGEIIEADLPIQLKA